MYIDYSKIVTKDLKSLVTEEDLASLKDMAKKERLYLNGKYNYVTLKEMVSQKANEIVYVCARYKEKSEAEKALIACNIVLDDEKTAVRLNTGKYDKDTLITFIKLLNYLKNKFDNNTISESDKKYLSIADTFGKKITLYFGKYIGNCEPDVIINKINELLSFRPELLETKQTTKIRK